MRRLPVSPTTLVSLLAFLVLACLILWTLRPAGLVSCEACMRFDGRLACGTAAAERRDLAVRGAAASACGELAGELATRMQCQSRQPERVTCGPDGKPLPRPSPGRPR